MAPLRGWAPRGTRLRAKVPYGRWKTMTFLAALRHDRIDAPWLLDGPINGETFQIYVEKLLVPTLRPGDIVVMDNLGSHKGKAVRRAIRAAGAKLFFLPKYSPDLNPIEQVFAKLKHLLRKAAARTSDAVCVAIGQLLDSFTPQECVNYFMNSGYEERLPVVRLPAAIRPADDDLQSLCAVGAARCMGELVPRACGPRQIDRYADDRFHAHQGAPLGFGRKRGSKNRRLDARAAGAIRRSTQSQMLKAVFFPSF